MSDFNGNDTTKKVVELLEPSRGVSQSDSSEQIKNPVVHRVVEPLEPSRGVSQSKPYQMSPTGIAILIVFNGTALLTAIAGLIYLGAKFESHLTLVGLSTAIVACTTVFGYYLGIKRRIKLGKEFRKSSVKKRE